MILLDQVGTSLPHGSEDSTAQYFTVSVH